jgi:hypothetical protein
MKLVKAFFLTTGIYSALIWLYCAARIIVDNIDPWDPFINKISITFWELGLVAFLVSATCCFAFLAWRK